MFAAAEPITGADAPLEVIVGLGVLLAFVGIVVRAFAARSPNRRHRNEESDPKCGSARPAARVTRPPDSCAQEAADRWHGTAGEAPEPELARLRPETLAPLAGVLDKGRRLSAAEDRVAGELDALPHSFWLVERGALVDGRRIPFLVVGATGVFLVCPSDGAWTLHDLEIMSELADEVRRRLPGYDGEPHAAVCLAFDAMEPREWFGGERLRGRGGWVLGADWLQRWIIAFGPEHGLRSGDIRRLDEASGPLWERRSTARLPANANHG
jgi:hypothetical protein